MTLTPAIKGLATKARKNYGQDGGKAFRSLVSNLSNQMPRQQAKHFAKRLLAA